MGLLAVNFKYATIDGVTCPSTAVSRRAEEVRDG
jgi:hypothetical protein